MGSDLLIMIYGAIMGVVGSIVTSIVTVIFQLWLERREYGRRQSEEHHRQLQQIHLPTDEEVRMINSDHQNDHHPETSRTAAEAGSVILSIILSSALVYHVRDPILGFTFGACLGFLMTRRITKFLKQ